MTCATSSLTKSCVYVCSAHIIQIYSFMSICIQLCDLFIDNESCICVMWHRTHSYVRHNWMICAISALAMSRVYVCSEHIIQIYSFMSICIQLRDLFIDNESCECMYTTEWYSQWLYVYNWMWYTHWQWVVYMCNMTQNSFTCVTWLVQMCDTTARDIRINNESCICVMWRRTRPWTSSWTSSASHYTNTRLNV